MSTKSKYIEIQPAGNSKTGKTKVWDVTNVRTVESIGEIRWYGGWRKYGFYPKPPEYEGQWVVFDEECLKQIGEFLAQTNKQRRVEKKSVIYPL